MEQRPETQAANRLETLLVGTPIRGPLHAKGGYQVLCISDDLAFTSAVAHLAAHHDAHPAIAWSVEDVERLPFWSFHGVVLDTEAWRDVESRGSPRVRALLARRPIVVAPRHDAEQAFKMLVADMAAANTKPSAQS